MSFQKTCTALVSLLAVVTVSSAANAQVVSQVSNGSGYNNSNSHGYTGNAYTGGLGRYSESVISRANQLSQEIQANQQAVVNAQAKLKNNSITQYTRKPADNNKAGINGENCPPDPNAVAELERAQASLAQANAAANSYLASIQNPNAELVQKTSACTTCGKGW